MNEQPENVPVDPIVGIDGGTTIREAARAHTTDGDRDRAAEVLNPAGFEGPWARSLAEERVADALAAERRRAAEELAADFEANASDAAMGRGSWRQAAEWVRASMWAGAALRDAASVPRSREKNDG